MSEYDTGNPVPSASIPDAWDNMQSIDRFANSSDETITTRTGKQLDTLHGINVKADSQRTEQQDSFELSQSERASSFEEKTNEFESRFSSQLSTQESTFSESQTDKENRFQQFLLSSGYVFLGYYENGPFQFSARNQYIRYDNQYYRLNAATDVGFTTTGTDATSFANDVTHFVLMDGDTLRQNLSAGAGFGMIGQCNDYAALRQVTPEYPGQQILVRSACESWSPSGSALPGEPASFVCLSGMTLADFPDDGGTLIAAADGVSVWVNMALFRDRKIHVSWFGAKNNYTDDASDAIEAAFAASEFWSRVVAGSTRGPLAHRWTVVFPQKWTASRTLTYNPVLAELDFDGGTGIFLRDGNYSTHPQHSDVPMLFYMKCEKPSGAGSDLYIPAYNDFPLAKNGSVIFGVLENGQPASGVIYNQPPDTLHAMFAHHGLSEVLYTALGDIENVSIDGAGIGYINGDYAWGTRFIGVKFVNCNYPASFHAGLDNGERFDFIGGKTLNCNHGFAFNDWAGQINWHQGSFDYFKQDAPFTWDVGGKAIFSITQPHFEFNPYLTGCMFDLSAADKTARVSIRDAFMVLAVPATSGVINNAFIKRAYCEQVVVDGIVIVDVSASGQFTKNYLLLEDQSIPALVKNINPATLKDYFVASPFLNRQRITKWQFYFVGSEDFVPTFTDDSVSVAGSSSAVAGQDKSLFIFIPAADVKTNVQFLLGMLTCTRCDVNVAFAMWTGYSKSASPGLVSASDIVIDEPVGAEQLVTLKVGRNSSVTAYAGGEINPDGYTLADWARPVFNKPAEGLIVRIWLYNQGPGDTVTLSANSGLITL
ncbi:hypothetical protein [Klebsiella variicola]|uniref:hypothetical protein n=2 Tax=Klebsiella variicola TaxID=244366 RepID=UPI001E65273D|nr:hypothetical protein [Klebsiella variicola]